MNWPNQWKSTVFTDEKTILASKNDKISVEKRARERNDQRFIIHESPEKAKIDLFGR